MEGVRQEREAAHQRMHSVRPGDFKGPDEELELPMLDKPIFTDRLISKIPAGTPEIIEVDHRAIFQRRGWL